MSEGRHGTARSYRHVAGQGARSRRRRRRRIGIAVVVVAASIGGAAVAWGVVGRGADVPSASSTTPAAACTAPQPLTVVTSPMYAGMLESLSASLAQGTDDGAPCAQLTVVAAGPAADGSVAVGAGATALLAGPGELASLSAGAQGAGFAVDEATTVATTIAVVAMPQPLAAAAGLSNPAVTWPQLAAMLVDQNAWSTLGRPELGAFTVSMSNPAASGAAQAGLGGLAAGALNRPLAELAPQDLAQVPVQGALFGLDRQVTRRAASESALLEALSSADAAGELATTTSLAFLDEQAVWSFNAAGATTPLTALYPQDGTVTLPLSWAPLTGPDVSADQHAAAQQLGAYLTGAAGQALLGDHGWRRVDGQPSASLTAERGVLPDAASAPASEGTSAVLAVATGGWARVENPGRFLAVLDVSGSMADPVPGTGRTRLQFAQDAAIQRMKALPRGGEIGLWEFSTKLDGDTDYRELVPVGKVSDVLNGRQRIDVLVDSVNGLTPQADTGLYDTLLAAFRSMRAGYQPGEPNDIVLVTDGRNDDPGSIDLATLLATLSAEQDTANPVRILCIAYGTEADLDSLGKIATATGGAVYDSPNPAAIGDAFFKALSGS